MACHVHQKSSEAAALAASPPHAGVDTMPRDEAVNELETKRREALEAARAAEAARGRSQELLGRFASMSFAREQRAESDFAAKAAALERSTAAAKKVLRIKPISKAVPAHVLEEEQRDTPESQNDMLLYGIHAASDGDELLVEELPVESEEDQQWVRVIPCKWVVIAHLACSIV